MNNAVYATQHTFPDTILQGPVIDFRTYLARTKNNDDALEDAINAAEHLSHIYAAAQIRIPRGSWNFFRPKYFRQDGLSIIGEGKYNSRCIFNGNIDGFVFGQNDVNTTNMNIRDVNISAGRYPLRLNNTQYSNFENSNIEGGTYGIYGEGQLEGNSFKNLNIGGYTLGGIWTGNLNGGADLGHNFPQVQKTLFENIIMGGSGCAIKFDSNVYNALPGLNMIISLKHIVAQGYETRFIDGKYLYGLDMLSCNSEIQGAIADNVHTSIYIGTGSQMISMNQCWPSVVGNGGGRFKYGIEIVDGHLFMRNCNFYGNDVGTADIFMDGQTSMDLENIHVHAIPKAIIFNTNWPLQKGRMSSIFDKATNVPIITGWPNGLNYDGAGPLYSGKNVGSLTVKEYLTETLANVPVHANNAAALLGGLGVGMEYRTGADPDFKAIVH